MLILDNVPRVNDEIIIDFLSLNPQLRTLHVSNCALITTSILKGIGIRSPNLEHLTLVLLSTGMVNEDWMQIGNVQNLKSLRTNLDQIVTTKSLIDLLIENNSLSIEKLYVESVYENIENDLAKLKNLKIFSAVHCSNNNKVPMELGAICINTHQWICELCNIH